ncbi:MAG: hypothetical protein LBD48_10060, partial [Treponema sp.]|nr:hypothetical protein [Treponema sp.]
MRKLNAGIFFLGIFIFPAFTEQRSFNAIFPNLSPEIRSAVFSSDGYIKPSERASGFVLAGGNNTGIDDQIKNAVLGKNPGFVVESIIVVPSAPGAVSLLKVYNALGNIRGLKGRLYHSQTRNEEVPLFEDATRLQSERRNTAIPDPAPAAAVP